MTEGFGDDIFAALASPVRRSLIQLLHDHGEMPVAELASHFEMTRPSISEHLKVLKDVGLVTEHRQGRQRIYRMHAAALQEIQGWLGHYLGTEAG